jgi:uncharacterized protein YwqG
LKLGESRIGGLPDVPPGSEWPLWLPPLGRDNKYGEPYRPEKPVPLSFIAQIDLQAVSEMYDDLPDTGWLFFFYDRYWEPWGYDPADRGCCRILYANCDRSELMTTEPPVNSDPEHLAEACSVEASLEWNLPDNLENNVYRTSVYEAYNALLDELTGTGGSTHHHLLGYPQLIQHEMELECQLASNGIDCGIGTITASSTASDLVAGARDWQLLLQIDTDDDGPGWMWGDCGRIYFWIKRKDLASLRFEDAWLIQQCY